MQLAQVMAELRVRIQATADRLWGPLSPDKRRLALILAAAVIIALLVIFAITKLAPDNQAGEVPAAVKKTVQESPVKPFIPPDGLFLPDEPDFIPGVMPDRPQRTEWTAEDASPYWQDPLKDGEEEWRNHIEKFVDEIMEKIP